MNLAGESPFTLLPGYKLGFVVFHIIGGLTINLLILQIVSFQMEGRVFAWKHQAAWTLSGTTTRTAKGNEGLAIFIAYNNEMLIWSHTLSIG